MWCADSQQKFLPKTPSEGVKCISDKPAKNSSHEVRKFCSEFEKIKDLYTSWSFFSWNSSFGCVECCSDSFAGNFWGKFWNFLSQSQKMIWINSFMQVFVSWEFSSGHSEARLDNHANTFSRKFWEFFPGIPKVLTFFLQSLFGKMLLWRGKSQLWWHLRSFLPKFWKSSAQNYKLVKKNDFISKDFSLRKSPLDT